MSIVDAPRGYCAMELREMLPPTYYHGLLQKSGTLAGEAST